MAKADLARFVEERVRDLLNPNTLVNADFARFVEDRVRNLLKPNTLIDPYAYQHQSMVVLKKPLMNASGF